jgi:hypothetical protein
MLLHRGEKTTWRWLHGAETCSGRRARNINSCISMDSLNINKLVERTTHLTGLLRLYISYKTQFLARCATLMQDETAFQRAGEAMNLDSRVVLRKLKASTWFSGVHYLNPCSLSCPQVKIKMVRTNQFYPVLADWYTGMHWGY